MNRRIRKKKHRGEFDFAGFSLEIEFKTIPTEVESVEMMDSFFSALEKNNLEFGGGWSTKKVDVFITKVSKQKRLRRGRIAYNSIDCTKEDRKFVDEWLRDNCNFTCSISMGQLSGSWSGIRKPY